MSKRLDLHKILILGSGPIIIGQGCEFDYSGVQACRVLKSVGYQVILVNSNPATIMTDPDMADHTYIEPITWQSVAKIIEKEKPDAILSTMGGQTALNCALDLEEQGILAKYNVELIGANKHAIRKAENRELFRQSMRKIGLEMPVSAVAHTLDEAWQIQTKIGFPCIIRPSFTLGGSGGGIAYNAEQFVDICERGFALSMNHQLLIEESLLGWKEYELEVIRDIKDSCIIVCTIENFDPMGIHTGDSITVAPAQTLTDVEYQRMRNAAIAILREIGVQTGGSNVQFAINPVSGRMIVIEMNPRVSRSSALASKATGFPIAKIAALLAVGYTLDELQNDITGGLIPASFEPSIDYVVVKIPRFNFDKFAANDTRLTTQMHSVGEVMAIGETFQMALQKAICSLELDLTGFDSQYTPQQEIIADKLIYELQHAGALRLLYIADAFRFGMSIENVHSHTGIDPWFLDQIYELVQTEREIQQHSIASIAYEDMMCWKLAGFSDARIAELLRVKEEQVRLHRWYLGIHPKFKHIDSCAAEFPAATSYLYAGYSGECEASASNKKKVIVLGSGPNRIGQGIEFDYCCVQAVKALQEQNIEAIMVNCNPETVSTDYDISNKLYFESLTVESVLEIIRLEQPFGVILQLGGQTPLKLASQLQQNGVNILGSSLDTIDIAEDRGKFSKLITKLNLRQPENAMVHDAASGLLAGQALGFPLILRPSYVLGGRAMEIVTNVAALETYLSRIFSITKEAPVLIDRFLQDAIEVDVDLIADSFGNVLIAGIMEHVEPAGIHSGDSGSSLPPHTLPSDLQDIIKQQAKQLALELKILGIMNIQFAIKNNEVFVLEVNPRASRTVPFVSKAIGIPVVKVAVNCMLGKSLLQMQLSPLALDKYAVKQSVFPFNKFLGADPLLGPEMRSTGEVMCFGNSFAEAYLKTMQAISGVRTKSLASVLLILDALDQFNLDVFVSELVESKVQVYTNVVTAKILERYNIACNVVHDEDKIVSLISGDNVDFIVCTPSFGSSLSFAKIIRCLAIKHRISYATTVAGAKATLLAMRYGGIRPIHKLQALHEARL